MMQTANCSLVWARKKSDTDKRGGVSYAFASDAFASGGAAMVRRAELSKRWALISDLELFKFQIPYFQMSKYSQIFKHPLQNIPAF